MRCVYVDLEGVELAPRALEVCRRAGVLVVPVTSGVRPEGWTDCVFDGGFVIDGEEHPGGVAEHARARGFAPEECLTVRAGEDLYEAVVTALMERR